MRLRTSNIISHFFRIRDTYKLKNPRPQNAKEMMCLNDSQVREQIGRVKLLSRCTTISCGKKFFLKQSCGVFHQE